MKPLRWIQFSGLVGAAGVGLGAFGAHALRATLEMHGMMAVWQTASLYHLLHSVVLLVLSLSPGSPKLAKGFFAAGLCVFSGSLYLLALTQIRWLGAITPLGGSLLILGWLSLLWSAKPTHAPLADPSHSKASPQMEVTQKSNPEALKPRVSAP
jgi:uncharacterized membrane protein YgdD (TMEM256/DUF423 family)